MLASSSPVGRGHNQEFRRPDRGVRPRQARPQPAVAPAEVLSV